MSWRIFMRSLLFCILLVSLTPAWASQSVVVADFSAGVNKDGVPQGWQLKEKAGNADFAVVRDGLITALRLRSQDTSFALQRAVDVNPQSYPLISWKWKVTKLPEGGDCRNSKTDDQAAQLFLAFSNANVISYIWDTTAPHGLVEDTWSFPFVTVKAIVLRSGHSETGKWVTETRNAYEDYRELFGHEPPGVAGIRIQINSQHTETSGESFFADVIFKRQ
ncbi:MAG: DUF3047 domain-containing protein [Desulfobacteraceae bacterium]|nr:DUF3047 domain-containing protein [Desulfobacteraceae bacterium]